MGPVRPAAVGGRCALASLVGIGDVSKRILLGRKLRSSQLGETLLPKRIALPVFASDALSSVAYAPDEIFIMLASPGVGVRVVLEGRARGRRGDAHGGGVVPPDRARLSVRRRRLRGRTVNLGRQAGVTVASALLVDYILTVAVSISSASQYAAAALPFFAGHEVLVASAHGRRAGRDEPARGARVGHVLRGADLPVHGRDPGDVRPTA